MSLTVIGFAGEPSTFHGLSGKKDGSGQLEDSKEQIEKGLCDL